MSSGESKQKILHKAEVSILRTLRRAENARFSELMRPTGLSSDNFKFYLRNLVKCEWVAKTAGGTYVLTAVGKEFANNLSETKQMVQKQPKLSVMLVVARQDTGSETEYLFQERLRHPYYGFWGCLSGPVLWGESIEQAAQMELRKQTGLTATCTVRSFCRQADSDLDGSLLEDKLFAVVAATDVQGGLTDAWHGGNSRWMTLADLAQTEKHFPLTTQIIELIQTGQSYTSLTSSYSPADY